MRGFGSPRSRFLILQNNGHTALRVSSVASDSEFSIRKMNWSLGPSGVSVGYKKLNCDHRSVIEFGAGVPDRMTLFFASGAMERTAAAHLLSVMLLTWCDSSRTNIEVVFARKSLNLSPSLAATW